MKGLFSNGVKAVVLELLPGFEQARQNLGNALARQGRAAEAAQVLGTSTPR